MGATETCKRFSPSGLRCRRQKGHRKKCCWWNQLGARVVWMYSRKDSEKRTHEGRKRSCE